MIKNTKVYGMNNSFRVSRFPKSVDVDILDDICTDRIYNLATSPKGEGHDNFLKGIIVQFDLTASIKFWTEAERYHWFEIVSSQSTMHKISDFDFKACMNEYVTENTLNEMERLKKAYKTSQGHDDYLRLLYNCPVGLKLTAGMTTNYRQLKTIYSQRKNHRLPEWKQFCKWIESLPHSEFITGETDGQE